MNPAQFVDVIIPVVAILATFGAPVAFVFVWKWFKFKEHELQVDAELRRTSGAALESRVQRLESIILALDSDVRQKLAAQAPLMEPPPLASHDAPAELAPPVKTRS
jgi:hypothetical protein